MPILLENGAVFLHVPKAGGNWVTAVLRELDLVKTRIPPKHGDVRALFSPPPGRRVAAVKHAARLALSGPRRVPFLFSFVRHPLSWYESWFKYMSQPTRDWRAWGGKDDPHDWHPCAMLNGLGSSDFNDFVRNVVRKRPGFVTELLGWYTTPEVDFVGKQERLASDLARALTLMGVEFDEEKLRERGRVGASPEPDEPLEWDEELRREVLRVEYAACLRYGYEPRV